MVTAKTFCAATNVTCPANFFSVLGRERLRDRRPPQKERPPGAEGITKKGNFEPIRLSTRLYVPGAPLLFTESTYAICVAI